MWETGVLCDGMLIRPLLFSAVCLSCGGGGVSVQDPDRLVSGSKREASPVCWPAVCGLSSLSRRPFLVLGI